MLKQKTVVQLLLMMVSLNLIPMSAFGAPTGQFKDIIELWSKSDTDYNSLKSAYPGVSMTHADACRDALRKLTEWTTDPSLNASNNQQIAALLAVDPSCSIADATQESARLLKAISKSHAATLSPAPSAPVSPAAAPAPASTKRRDLSADELKTHIKGLNVVQNGPQIQMYGMVPKACAEKLTFHAITSPTTTHGSSVGFRVEGSDDAVDCLKNNKDVDLVRMSELQTTVAGFYESKFTIADANTNVSIKLLRDDPTEDLNRYKVEDISGELKYVSPATRAHEAHKALVAAIKQEITDKKTQVSRAAITSCGSLPELVNLRSIHDSLAAAGHLTDSEKKGAESAFKSKESDLRLARIKEIKEQLRSGAATEDLDELTEELISLSEEKHEKETAEERKIRLKLISSALVSIAVEYVKAQTKESVQRAEKVLDRASKIPHLDRSAKAEIQNERFGLTIARLQIIGKGGTTSDNPEFQKELKSLNKEALQACRGSNEGTKCVEAKTKFGVLVQAGTAGDLEKQQQYLERIQNQYTQGYGSFGHVPNPLQNQYGGNPWMMQNPYMNPLMGGYQGYQGYPGYPGYRGAGIF